MSDSSPKASKRAPGARRALSHVGGRIELAGGNQREREAIERALNVEADESRTMAHVHGFHTYPARLHPETAARLIEGLTEPKQVVLDPFCGSGTVLVEARRLGRRALGVDANPLAVELSWLKTRHTTAEFVTGLQNAARAVAEHANERRLAKAGPVRRYGPEDLELYDRHVLLELDGLADGIFKMKDREVARALKLVLSAALTKLSKRVGDTTKHTQTKRIAGGFASRFFLKKTEELAQRLLAFTKLVPEASAAPRIQVGDARKLEGIASESVALILSSPPYPGVYDYFEHHVARLRWLGLEAGSFRSAEIGARRTVRGLPHRAALERWEAEFGACLAEFARVLSPTGRLALVIADSVLGGRAVRADQVIPALAVQHHLQLVARGSQERPHFHLPTQSAFRERARREHVLLFAKAGREVRPRRIVKSR